MRPGDVLVTALTQIRVSKLRSLFTLSIIRITIFDPVGTVNAVFAALLDVGRAGGRSLPDSRRGSEPEVEGAAEVV